MKRTGFFLLLIILPLCFRLIHSVQSNTANIVISEIGNHETTDHEWVEITNSANTAVSIADWSFYEDSTHHDVSLVTGTSTLSAGSRAIIAQDADTFIDAHGTGTVPIFDSSWNTLKENGEEIGLVNAEQTLIDTFTYPTTTASTSLERVTLTTDGNDASNWRQHPDSHSLGQKNYWHAATPQNSSPTPVITAPTSTILGVTSTFSAASSTDEDGTIDTFSWTHPNGEILSGIRADMRFATSGTSTVILKITDNNGAAASTSYNIFVAPPPAPPAIVLNEIMVDPNNGNEWIELFNASTQSVDLRSWTIKDGIDAILSPSTTLGPHSYMALDISNNKLNNSGDVIILKDKNNTTVDTLSYGDWTPQTSAHFSAPNTGHTIARDPRSQAWKITATASKQGKNIIQTPHNDAAEDDTHDEEETEENDDVNSDNTTTQASNAVRINELLPAPTGGDKEFVELYNSASTSIAIDSLTLTDVSGAATTLHGSIAAYGYYLVHEPSGHLNNNGDTITLHSSSSTVDHVSYPEIDSDRSYARNEHGSWQISDTVTPGAANTITISKDDSENDADKDEGSDHDTTQETQTKTRSDKIVISELLPNPDGADSDAEFIELHSTDDEAILIEGWTIRDAADNSHSIGNITLKPHDYHAFYRDVTGIALNNSGDESVTLHDADNNTIDTIHYSTSTPSGMSFNRNSTTDYWSAEPTPNAKNKDVLANEPPTAIINTKTHVTIGSPVDFDASDSSDPDGDTLTYHWTFGDSDNDDGDYVTHRFTNPGVYTVSLDVRDQHGARDTAHIIITVSELRGTQNNIAHNVAAIRINEILPNPHGSDRTEFIELWNPTDEAIDISLLRIDDIDGGSRAYTIPEETRIDAESYLVLGRQQTGIALNNTGDSARLTYPDGSIIRSIRYDTATEGASYARTPDRKYEWTSTPTPGKQNAFAALASNSTNKKSRYVRPIQNTTLTKLPLSDLGDKLRVAGIVASEPGVLGSQYFYIVADATPTSTSAGVQVYLHNKNFPELRIGDKVRVHGELSEARGELRLKASEQSDIQVIDHGALPEGRDIELASVSDELEGQLITANGEVTEVKSTHFYIDDGSDELKVYLKKRAGFSGRPVALGDIADVTGILSQTRSGFRLLPRSPQDIEKTGVIEDVVVAQKEQQDESSAEVAEKYLTATAGGLTSILLGLIAKARGSIILQFVFGIGRRAVAVVRRFRG